MKSKRFRPGIVALQGGRADFVNDTVIPTYRLAISGQANENFVVSLIKRLARANANFTNVLDLTSDSRGLSPKVLKAFLDAGADPDKFSGRRKQSILFDLLEGSTSPQNVEKIKILVDHQASLTKGIYGFRDHAMCFFLQHRGLAITSNLTRSNLNLIFSVIDILRDAGADTSDAKEYLDALRNQLYRNVPEALSYINEIEKRMDKSMSSGL